MGQYSMSMLLLTINARSDGAVREGRRVAERVFGFIGALLRMLPEYQVRSSVVNRADSSPCLVEGAAFNNESGFSRLAWASLGSSASAQAPPMTIRSAIWATSQS